MRELATHTSGLPRQPPNLNSTGKANPFTNYTREDLYACLGGRTPKCASLPALPTRGAFLYSNFAFGLLGHALELRAGMQYEKLVQTAVLGSLHMKDTKITLSAEQWETQVAVGRDSKTGQPAERRTPYGVLKGQGAYH